VRRASLLVTGLAALVLLAAALTARAPQGPRLDLVAASGALQITNSQAGQAILRGEGLRPGEAATGSLTLTNAGDARAALALDAAIERETAGAGGGRLWDALDVVVSDVTDPRAPFAVYAGPLADMGRLTFGALAPAQRRTYQFAVSLARAGNAYQGARLSLGLAWSAQADDPPAPATQTPPPRPAAAPPVPVAAQDLLSLPSAKRCVSRRRFTVRVRGGSVATTTVYVNGRRTGRGRGSHAVINLRGLPRGTLRLRVVAVLTDGRRLVLSRTYRTCRGR
jgi:hypothetical protein